MPDKTLPPKPSDLLELALNDLAKVEQLPGYKVNMSVWHDHPGGGAACHVCLAGAVMSMTLEVPITEAVNPAHFLELNPGIGLTQQLHALNQMRRGYWGAAFRDLGIEPPDGLYARLPQVVENYHDDPVEFRAAMRRSVDVLREAGM